MRYIPGLSTHLLALACLLAFSMPAVAQSVVTEPVGFQGRLNKPDGTPVADTTTQSLTFRVYNAATNGGKLWEQALSSVSVKGGVFAVSLDFSTGFIGAATNASVFNGSPAYLEVQSGLDLPMTPRRQLTAVPYAFTAQTAQTVPDGSITLPKLAPGVLNFSNIGGSLSLSQIPDGVITGNKLADGTITNADLSASLQQTLNLLGVTPTLAPKGTGFTSHPYSVALSGTYAYVASDSGNALQVLDISNPAAPNYVGAVSTGAGTTPESVAVSGTHAYVAEYNGNALQIVDISNPASPTLAGSLATGASTNPRGVAVSGNYAYVVNYNSSTLQVVDVSNPASPVSVGTAATGLHPDGVVVSGAYAYVVTFGSGSLQVFDVSNPALPSLKGSVSVSGVAEALAVSGNYAYVPVYNDAMLKIINISNPLSPSIVGSVNTAANPASIAVVGSYACVGSLSNSVQMFDISIPASPTLVASSATSGQVYSAAAQGNYLYAAIAPGTLQAFQLTQGFGTFDQLRFGDGTTQATAGLIAGSAAGGDLTGTYPNPQIAPGVVSRDKLSASVQQTLSLNPLKVVPTLMGTAPLSGTPKAVAVSGRYAFAVNEGSNSLQIIDVNNPAGPTVKGSATTGASPRSVAASGVYAYVASYNDGLLQVFNVSNPVNPTLTGSVTAGAHSNGVAVSGGYAYVTNDTTSTLKVFNVANPAAPTLAGSVSTGAVPGSVAASGNYAYVASAVGGGTLQVINVSNPANPAVTGSVVLGAQPTAIAVSGTHVYVVSVGNTLKVIDVSNPASPVAKASISTGAQPSSVAVLESYVTVAGGPSTGFLQVFDVTDPANPVLKGSGTPGFAASGVAMAGNYAYVLSGGNVGLQVFQLVYSAVQFGDGTVQTTAGLVPGSTAGGDLTGAYPNPAIAANAVNSGKLTSDATSLAKVSAGAVNVSGANVGIGLTNPAYKLEVNGDINAKGVVRANGVALTSDARYKQDVATIGDALDTILSLRGVTFDWNRNSYPSMGFPEGRQVGFIAQELEQVLPELVSTDPQGMKSVAYQNIVPVLVEAVKDQQRQLAGKDTQIAALRARNDAQVSALQKQNAAMEARLKRLEERLDHVSGSGRR